MHRALTWWAEARITRARTAQKAKTNHRGSTPYCSADSVPRSTVLVTLVWLLSAVSSESGLFGAMDARIAPRTNCAAPQPNAEHHRSAMRSKRALLEGAQPAAPADGRTRGLMTCHRRRGPSGGGSPSLPAHGPSGGGLPKDTKGPAIQSRKHALPAPTSIQQKAIDHSMAGAARPSGQLATYASWTESAATPARQHSTLSTASFRNLTCNKQTPRVEEHVPPALGCNPQLAALWRDAPRRQPPSSRSFRWPWRLLMPWPQSDRSRTRPVEGRARCSLLRQPTTAKAGRSSVPDHRSCQCSLRTLRCMSPTKLHSSQRTRLG